MINDLKVVSWNLCGLNIPIKRVKCLDLLYRHHIDIAMIQQTHFKALDTVRLQNKYYKTISSSCAASKSKGVVILARRKLDMQIHRTG